MSKSSVLSILSGVLVGIESVAGDLTVEGSLHVTSNLTASVLSATNATVGSLAVNGSAVFSGTIQGDGAGITNLMGVVSAQELVQAIAVAATPLAGTQSLASAVSGLNSFSQSVVSAVSDLSSNTVPISRTIAINADAQSLSGDVRFFIPPNPANVTDFTYITNAANEIVITGYVSQNEDVVIPDNINGFFVTKIGDSAFCGLSFISFSGGANITEIGSNAFYSCRSLTTVSLPAVTSIKNNAFRSCVSLSSLALPSAAVIGENAFYECYSLTSISLPSTVSIGKKRLIPVPPLPPYSSLASHQSGSMLLTIVMP